MKYENNSCNWNKRSRPDLNNERLCRLFDHTDWKIRIKVLHVFDVLFPTENIGGEQNMKKRSTRLQTSCFTLKILVESKKQRFSRTQMPYKKIK